MFVALLFLNACFVPRQQSKILEYFCLVQQIACFYKNVRSLVSKVTSHLATSKLATNMQPKTSYLPTMQLLNFLS